MLFWLSRSGARALMLDSSFLFLPVCSLCCWCRSWWCNECQIKLVDWLTSDPSFLKARKKIFLVEGTNLIGACKLKTGQHAGWVFHHCWEHDVCSRLEPSKKHFRQCVWIQGGRHLLEKKHRDNNAAAWRNRLSNASVHLSNGRTLA